MLYRGKVILPHSLRGDPDQQSTAFAHRSVQVSPGFQLGDAVRAPAPAEEVDHQRSQRQQITAPHNSASGVRESKFRSFRADLKNSVLGPRRIEFCHRTLADLEALWLN